MSAPGQRRKHPITRTQAPDVFFAYDTYFLINGVVRVRLGCPTPHYTHVKPSSYSANESFARSLS